MTRIAVVVGSTRPNRLAPAVARWVLGVAATRPGAVHELLDVADFDLPLYDEPWPAMVGSYEGAHTRRWADAVASYDGFVVVTGEYNHGPPAALKNALDYLYAEWNDKPIGFVGFGGAGGARAVEQLRLNSIELRMAPVAASVGLVSATDFASHTEIAPTAGRDAQVHTLLDQVETWARALASVRGGGITASPVAR
ncbi:NADPH-dependent FMN reductase [Actinomycetospora aeridis]|uniref:NAD(P)H-dependent oxidoreductase n=1 Tax=Actinomycetospora aeridis TaxID=3129231 RepID=A0ABU8NDR8_9PSEU